MPTFAFEVSYMYNGQLKEGWLTNKNIVQHSDIYYVGYGYRLVPIKAD